MKEQKEQFNVILHSVAEGSEEKMKQFISEKSEAGISQFAGYIVDIICKEKNGAIIAKNVSEEAANGIVEETLNLGGTAEIVPANGTIEAYYLSLGSNYRWPLIS
jgi:hypothetical protein